MISSDPAVLWQWEWGEDHLDLFQQSLQDNLPQVAGELSTKKYEDIYRQSGKMSSSSKVTEWVRNKYIWMAGWGHGACTYVGPKTIPLPPENGFSPNPDRQKFTPHALVMP